MPLLLKDIDELKMLDAEVYEVDPTKHYLIVMEDAKRPEYLELLVSAFRRKGINASVLAGVDPKTWHMFKMEHTR